ncbi:AVAST type 1 anti-phage system protein Avs1c [Aquimarina latercula]|uniref:AVAST type 1 anti-phage system protein Avs1c n=1 Tax=Aquimarina latercula TaxID=987 RepID=UPI0006853807|nr:AVAST type 1 anti-phage system protein Avs1c [Aquimarina latercula]
MKTKRAHVETRKEFERNLNILRELMINGKIKFSKSLDDIEQTKASMLRARELPNKRFDFNTVNELLRLTANTAGQMQDRQHEEEE